MATTLIYKKLALYSLTLIMAATSVFAVPASALNVSTPPAECSTEYMQSNGVFFTNPCATTCAPTGDTIGDISANEAAEAIFKFFISTNFTENGNKPLTAVQAAAFMGNFQVESRFNPAVIQGGQSYNEEKAMNPKARGYAFGLAQWDSGRRAILLNFAKQKKADWRDIKLQFQFIKFELDSESVKMDNGEKLMSPESRILKDSKFQSPSTSIKDAAFLVSEIYERPGYPHNPDRARNAESIYKKYSSLAPSADMAVINNTDSGPPACNTGVSPGNGDIAETAKRLSWPERGHDKKPNDAYKEALAQTGVNKLGDSCSMAGNGCDAFLATVLRLSGADPKFPCCGANMQGDYMAKNSDQYEEIKGTFKSGATREEKNRIIAEAKKILAPGDILFLDGRKDNNSYAHVKIYLGDGKEAGASHCERTAEQSALIFDGSYRVFRAKQTGGPSTL